MHILQSLVDIRIPFWRYWSSLIRHTRNWIVDENENPNFKSLYNHWPCCIADDDAWWVGIPDSWFAWPVSDLKSQMPASQNNQIGPKIILQGDVKNRWNPGITLNFPNGMKRSPQRRSCPNAKSPQWICRPAPSKEAIHSSVNRNFEIEIQRANWITN